MYVNMYVYIRIYSFDRVHQSEETMTYKECMRPQGTSVGGHEVLLYEDLNY